VEKVESLVKVKADPTLKLWHQILKSQVWREKGLLKAQLVLDRIHRYNPRESKPLGYFHMSTVDQWLDLAVLALSTALAMAAHGRDVGVLELREALESAWRLRSRDIVFNAMRLLEGLGEVEG